jgi:hypothetical protein
MSEKFKFYFRTFFSLLGWAAIIITVYLRITSIAETGASYLGIFRPWRTFTVQTNTMVLLFWTFSFFYFNKDKKPFFLRPSVKGGIAVYITFTFIIFAIFLEGLHDEKGLRVFTSIIFHYVIPIAFVLDYLTSTQKKSLRFSHIVYWIVYPFCYSLFLTIYGLISHIFIYPFLNIEKLGWTRFSINSFGFMLFMLFLGFIYVLMNRRLPDRA